MPSRLHDGYSQFREILTDVKREYGLRTRAAIIIAIAFALFLTLFFFLSYVSIGDALRVRSEEESRAQLSAILRSAEDSLLLPHIPSIIEQHSAIGEARLRICLYRREGTQFFRIASSDSNSSPLFSEPELQALWEKINAPRVIVLGGKTLNVIADATEHYLGVAMMNPLVLEEAKDAMLGKFELLLAIGIVVAAGMGYAVAGFSLSPIRMLLEAARRISANPRNSPGQVVRRLPVPQRVTEVALLATAVNTLIDESERSIEQLQNFTADAAHELRTPLTVLKGELEVELRLRPPQDSGRELLKSNLEEVERLSAIVEDLLLLSKLDRPELIGNSLPERFSIARIVMQVASRLRPLAQSRGVGIEIELLGDVEILGDAEGFERMLYNIIQNGIHYTDREGVVRVFLNAEHRPAEILVADTGIGIASDDLPHVFERFYRAEKSRSRSVGGAGLGLAIAKSIADELGFILSIESAPQRGTQVLIILPSDAIES